MAINKAQFDPKNLVKYWLAVTNNKIIVENIERNIYIECLEHIRREVGNGNGFYLQFGLNHENFESKEPIIAEVMMTVIDLLLAKQNHLQIEIPFIRVRYTVGELKDKMQLYSFLS